METKLKINRQSNKPSFNQISKYGTYIGVFFALLQMQTVSPVLNSRRKDILINKVIKKSFGIYPILNSLAYKEGERSENKRGEHFPV